jgi:hypothetical protein
MVLPTVDNERSGKSVKRKLARMCNRRKEGRKERGPQLFHLTIFWREEGEAMRNVGRVARM